MTYICLKTFESTKGITYIKNRIINFEEYNKLNWNERQNFKQYENRR